MSIASKAESKRLHCLLTKPPASVMISTMDWHILGAGSIGCLWASKLLQNNRQVTMIVRPAMHQPEIQLKLIDLEGAEHQWPVTTVSHRTINRPVNRLLVCTKAQDAFDAVAQVAEYLSGNCQIVLMQNGMGSQQKIAETFSDYAVFAASTTEGAWLKDSFHICHAGKGNTWFGAINDKARQRQEGDFGRLSETIISVSNIEEKLWDKLAINCAINGLTALYNCRNGELLESAAIKARLNQLIKEVIETRQAVGLPSSSDLFETVHKVCQLTAANHSSTCVDARLGRKTELTYINGYLLKKARQHRLSLPENQRLMDELQQAGILW